MTPLRRARALPRTGMTPLTRNRVARTRLGAAGLRAATMLEFAIILPIFLFMMLFTIDMGSLMLMSGAMNDATFSAARASAQLGGANLKPPCTGMNNCADPIHKSTLDAAVAQIPFSSDLFDVVGEPEVVSGGLCVQDNSDNRYVKIRTQYKVRMITPGLGAMLNMMSEKNDGEATAPNEYELTAVGVSRCEVYRQAG